MRNVTEEMDRYRETLRLLWNVGFWADPRLRTWDSRDRFDQLRRLLFEALVVHAVGGAQGNSLELASVTLHVIPVEAHPVPILINCPRVGDHNSYWDDSLKAVRASDVEMHFIEYFDWNAMGYADLQYVRVKIAAFNAHPELIGRDALLEHRLVEVRLA